MKHTKAAKEEEVRTLMGHDDLGLLLCDDTYDTEAYLTPRQLAPPGFTAREFTPAPSLRNMVRKKDETSQLNHSVPAATLNVRSAMRVRPLAAANSLGEN